MAKITGIGLKFSGAVVAGSDGIPTGVSSQELSMEISSSIVGVAAGVVTSISLAPLAVINPWLYGGYVIGANICFGPPGIDRVEMVSSMINQEVSNECEETAVYLRGEGDHSETAFGGTGGPLGSV